MALKGLNCFTLTPNQWVYAQLAKIRFLRFLFEYIRHPFFFSFPLHFLLVGSQKWEKAIGASEDFDCKVL